MVKYEAKINGKKGDEFISADILIYDDESNQIGTIYITDESQFNQLKESVDNFSETYVSNEELETILKNTDNSTVINATSLKGMNGGEFTEHIKSELEENSRFKPVTHASSTVEYGAGTNSEYGHVKLVNHLNSNNYEPGSALSSYQGKVLSDKIKTLENVLKKFNGLQVRLGRKRIINKAPIYDGETDSRLMFSGNHNNTEFLYIQVYAPLGGYIAGRTVTFTLENINDHSIVQYAKTTDSKGRAELQLNWTSDRVIIAHATVQGNSNEGIMGASDFKILLYGSSTHPK